MKQFKKLGLLALVVSIGSTTAVMAGNLSSPSPYQQVSFSTTLGNRLQLIAPQQQDLQGKTTTTKRIKCGNSSGNCGFVTHALTAEGNYKFKDTGVYPIITMIVRSLPTTSVEPTPKATNAAKTLFEYRQFITPGN